MSPATDVGNASSLAAAALAHRRDGVLAYVVQGRFEHVNFIWRPAPLIIHVTEVIPPHPPKLLAMAEQVVGYDEDLPPVKLMLDAVDVQRAHGGQPGRGTTCCPAAAAACRTGQVSFLDCHPPYHPDWLLIGCDRSRQFHQHFYGAEPRRVELCPKARAAGPPGARVLDQVLPAGTGRSGGRRHGGGAVGRESGRGARRAPRALRPARRPQRPPARPRPGRGSPRWAPGHEHRASGRLARLRPPVDDAGSVRAVHRRGPDPGLAGHPGRAGAGTGRRRAGAARRRGPSRPRRRVPPRPGPRRRADQGERPLDPRA